MIGYLAMVMDMQGFFRNRRCDEWEGVCGIILLLTPKIFCVISMRKCGAIANLKKTSHADMVEYADVQF